MTALLTERLSFLTRGAGAVAALSPAASLVGACTFSGFSAFSVLSPFSGAVVGGVVGAVAIECGLSSLRSLHRLHRLLAGDGLARTLAGAGVALCVLAADREVADVTQAPVAADVLQTRDVLRDLTPELTLD